MPSFNLNLSSTFLNSKNNHFHCRSSTIIGKRSADSEPAADAKADAKADPQLILYPCTYWPLPIYRPIGKRSADAEPIPDANPDADSAPEANADPSANPQWWEYP